METPKWLDAFAVYGDPGGPPGAIRLRQLNRTEFALDCTIQYTGDTGLEKWLGNDADFDLIREVGPQHIKSTDLVSVPKPLRWFAGRYGNHTPAALVHDRFIGKDANVPIAGMTEQHADRYFRFMLRDTGVPWLRRWIMWAAVAFRTRFMSPQPLKRWSVIGWMVLLLGTWAGAAYAAFIGQWWWAALAVVVPIPLSFLWEKQFGAGLVAAYATPLLALPSLLAVIFDFVLYLLTKAIQLFMGMFMRERAREESPAQMEMLS